MSGSTSADTDRANSTHARTHRACASAKRTSSEKGRLTNMTTIWAASQAVAPLRVCFALEPNELRALASLLDVRLAERLSIPEAIHYAIWRAAGAPEHIARTLAQEPKHNLAVPLADEVLGVPYREAHPTLAEAGLTRSKR